MQWLTLFQKELQENWQNKKWIWVPLVLILVAVMDPLTYYYLPQIIDTVGGMPEGAIFEIPEKIHPAEAIMMSLGQLSMFGSLIIVLIAMGTISSEKRSGITEIILVKPIAYHQYVSSKWVSFLVLIIFSSFISMFTSWYYITILFGDMTFLLLLKIVFFYSLWFIFVLTVTFFYNTLINAPGLVAGMTILTLSIMSIFNKIFSHTITWFPNNLTTHIQEMVISDSISTDLIGTSAMLGLIIIGLFLATIYIFNKREKTI